MLLEAKDGLENSGCETDLDGSENSEKEPEPTSSEKSSSSSTCNLRTWNKNDAWMKGTRDRKPVSTKPRADAS